MNSGSLSLVLPAYNEAAVIAAAVAEAETALAKLFPDFEILVVDDGSSDATAAIVRRGLAAAPHTRLLRHAENRGYGAALRTGFEAARFDLVAFTDADCQFDLLDLGMMTELSADFPIVAGRRVDRKDSWLRRFYSWGYNKLAQALLGTGVHDCDCALKVFRREALAKLLPESRGFFVNAEMLTRARLLGYKKTEVPVAHRPRLGGESKVSLLEIPRTLRTMLAFWWRNLVLGRLPSLAPAAVLQTRIILDAEPVATQSPVSNRLPSTEPALPVAPPEPRREVA
ncbi:MAG TPA: glycosyltransferase family 2 protein [Urbifossiella sp.]